MADQGLEDDERNMLLPRTHKNHLNSSSLKNLETICDKFGLSRTLYLQDVDHDGDQELEDDERAQEVEAPEEDTRGDLVPHSGRHVQQRLVHLHDRR
jgi:hypothetical protein